jgi:hypothetical protein
MKAVSVQCNVIGLSNGWYIRWRRRATWALRGQPWTIAMRMILAATVLAALALQASAQSLPASAHDDPYGPQWHFMDHSADMRLLIRPWCVPNTPQWATCAHKGETWTGWWTTR